MEKLRNKYEPDQHNKHGHDWNCLVQLHSGEFRSTSHSIRHTGVSETQKFQARIHNMQETCRPKNLGPSWTEGVIFAIVSDHFVKCQAWCTKCMQTGTLHGRSGIWVTSLKVPYSSNSDSCGLDLYSGCALYNES